jgi:phage baseplate assembly protein W
MAIDKKIYEAVYEAVNKHEQPPKVAERMMLWLSHLSEGSASLSNSDDIKASLATILDAIKVGGCQGEEEELE